MNSVDQSLGGRQTPPKTVATLVTIVKGFARRRLLASISNIKCTRVGGGEEVVMPMDFFEPHRPSSGRSRRRIRSYPDVEVASRNPAPPTGG